jgi:hypothetical protein
VYDEIRVKKELTVIPDASHLFEEPVALSIVGGLASDWFNLHLKSLSAMVLP